MGTVGLMFGQYIVMVQNMATVCVYLMIWILFSFKGDLIGGFELYTQNMVDMVDMDIL